MNSYGVSDSLHRLVKQAVDSGEASSITDAEAMFRRYTLTFSISDHEANDPLHQAALLTGVALARRVFLGGVAVTGAVETPLQVPLPYGTKLFEAITALGGVVRGAESGGPLISIGGGPRPRTPGFHVRTMSAGWRGGFMPGHSELAPVPGRATPLAAMLSAALAVNEAFTYVGRQNRAAGRRAAGLSLWRPSASTDWLEDNKGEPELQYLPSKLWLIGLGHLGQAYLWALGMLPYRQDSGMSLVLQDVDRVTPSTESTGILCDQTMIGQMKTRVMAAWAEKRGFSTRIYERLFDGSFQRHSAEPAVALCGIDNGLGRRALDQVGFGFVVEAGLGHGHQNFRSIRLHTLPGPRPASNLWEGSDQGAVEDVAGRAAYRDMVAKGELDRCGVTVLAGKSVGAPFVGAVAACLAVSEVLRLLHGGNLHSVIEMDLQSVEHRAAVRRDDINDFNPGYVPVA
jgi:hypothetical protein